MASSTHLTRGTSETVESLQSYSRDTTVFATSETSSGKRMSHPVPLMSQRLAVGRTWRSVTFFEFASQRAAFGIDDVMDSPAAQALHHDESDRFLLIKIFKRGIDQLAA